MGSLKRATLGRLRFTLSLSRVWALLVAIALFLVAVEFRFLWLEMDTTTANPALTQQELLDAGFSHFGLNKLVHQADVRTSLPDTNADRRDIHGGGGHTVEKASLDGEQGVGGRREEVEKKHGSMLIQEHHLHYIRNLTLSPHNRWIVLDVTSGKCEGKLAVPSGWKILAIGETMRLQGCSPPSCTYLQPNPNISPQNVPWEQARVMWRHLAYLTAIFHKAVYILDADCSVILKKAVQILQYPILKDHGPMYNETLLFNPYAHFGAWAAVPRAMARKSLKLNSRMYYVRDFDSVLVKHGLSEKSDDLVPAISTGPSGTRFDPSTPPVFLGQGSFSAAMPTSSLYRQNAFWTLVFPCQTLSLRCQVLRQIVQQALLRELDAFSGFYQLTSAAVGGKQLQSNESNISIDVHTLVSLLNRRRCKNSFNFVECFSDVATYLQYKGHLSVDELALVRSWIAALQKFGAFEPRRASSPWRGVRRTSEVRITLGSLKARLESGKGKEEQHLKKLFVDTIINRCNGSNTVNWFPVAQWRKPLIEDVVLIVVFNWNRFFWNNLPFLETMHRPFFKHIVYCVPNVDELLNNRTDRILRHVNFVEGLSDTWYFMFECVTIAARMNIQGVRGYLQIGDDTLLNTWKFFTAPRDSMWIPNGFSTMKADDIVHSWGWYWWKKSRGRPAVLQALADLETISGMTSQQLLRLDPNFNKTKVHHRAVASFSEMFQAGKDSFPRMRPYLPGSEVWETPTKDEAVKFMTNYYKTNRMAGRVRHRALDFFYIPQVLSEAYVKFSRHFLKRNVLIELAVPAIHYGLVPRSKVKYVSASSLWKGDRNVTYSFYDESIFFLHPFKMKAHMEQKESHTFFCSDFMNILFSELYKHLKS